MTTDGATRKKGKQNVNKNEIKIVIKWNLQLDDIKEILLAHFIQN